MRIFDILIFIIDTLDFSSCFILSCKTCCKQIKNIFICISQSILTLSHKCIHKLFSLSSIITKKVENQAFQVRRYQDIHRRACCYLEVTFLIISTRCEEVCKDVIFIRSTDYWNTNLTCIISRQDITKVSCWYCEVHLISVLDMTCLNQLCIGIYIVNHLRYQTTNVH